MVLRCNQRSTWRCQLKALRAELGGYHCEKTCVSPQLPFSLQDWTRHAAYSDRGILETDWVMWGVGIQSYRDIRDRLSYGDHLDIISLLEIGSQSFLALGSTHSCRHFRNRYNICGFSCTLVEPSWIPQNLQVLTSGYPSLSSHSLSMFIEPQQLNLIISILMPSKLEWITSLRWSEFGDQHGGRDRATLAIHFMRMMVWLGGLTWRPSSCGIGCHNWANLDIDLQVMLV
jgi:hypothetical protein